MEDRTPQDRRPICQASWNQLQGVYKGCLTLIPAVLVLEASGQAGLEDRNQQTVRPRNHVMSQLKKRRQQWEARHDNLNSYGKSSSSKDVSYASSLQMDKEDNLQPVQRDSFGSAESLMRKWPLSGSVQIGRLERESLYQVRSWNA